MSLRQLRTLLNYFLVIFATLAAQHFYHEWSQQKGSRKVAEEIVRLCELPPLPGELTILHAEIVKSQNPSYADTNLTLTGPVDVLDDWLNLVDDWKKQRPGVILNHKFRESEWSPRVDFSAEIFLKSKS